MAILNDTLVRGELEITKTLEVEEDIQAGKNLTVNGNISNVSGTSKFSDNVGIGTDPGDDSKLKVNGGTSISGDTQIGTSNSDTANLTIYGNISNVSGTSKFSDNVGIGTDPDSNTSTDYKLKVSGDTYIDGSLTVTGTPEYSAGSTDVIRGQDLYTKLNELESDIESGIEDGTIVAEKAESFLVTTSETTSTYCNVKWDSSSGTLTFEL